MSLSGSKRIKIKNEVKDDARITMEHERQLVTMETLKKSFKLYSNRKKRITSKDITRWTRDAEVISSRGQKFTCTSNNLDIAFCKVKTYGRNSLTLTELETLVAEISISYQRDHGFDNLDLAYDAIVEKLANTIPKCKGVTFVSRTGSVARLCNTNIYTGTHRNRFDSEGRGMGRSGRVDEPKYTGYVHNYRGESKYDKKTGENSKCRVKKQNHESQPPKKWIREVVRVNTPRETARYDVKPAPADKVTHDGVSEVTKKMGVLSTMEGGSRDSKNPQPELPTIKQIGVKKCGSATF